MKSARRESPAASGGGMGLATGLFLLFTGLKLGKVISWSWWWVTSPVWITAAIALLIVGVVVWWEARK